MDKNECEDKYSEAETEEHLNGKRDLFEWIKKQSGVSNAVLEGWIPETKQRPDIMFDYNERKYVIEFQCSPISSEYIERHDLYKAAGIIDIWILGCKNYLQQNMREKYIQNFSYGFYNYKDKYFSPTCYSELLNILNKKYDVIRYCHSKNSFCSLPLNDFVFNGDISHVLLGDLKTIYEKRKQRKITNADKIKSKNKYLDKQIYRLKFHINESLNILDKLSNNWKFYLYRQRYVIAKPNYGSCDYKLDKYFDSCCQKIDLRKINFEELKQYSNNIDFLKQKLLPTMIYNKSIMLRFSNENIRVLEVIN